MVAITTEAVAAGLSLLSPTLAGLITARFLSGLGIGLVTATATAYLSELLAGAGSRTTDQTGDRAGLVATVANTGGLALGPLVSGVLSQYVTGPLHTPYLVSLIVLSGSAVAVSLVPETAGAQRVTGGNQTTGGNWLAALRPRPASVPATAKRHYLAATAASFTAFAVNGLFTALAPSVVTTLLGRPSPIAAGLAAFGVFAAGAVAQVLLRQMASHRQLAIGLVMMACGVVMVTAAVWGTSLPAFLAGGVVAGAGAGLLLRGAISAVSALAEPPTRAAALSGLFLAGYAGLTVPVLSLGVAMQVVEVRSAILGFSVTVLAAIAWLARSLLLPATTATRVRRGWPARRCVLLPPRWCAAAQLP